MYWVRHPGVELKTPVRSAAWCPAGMDGAPGADTAGRLALPRSLLLDVFEAAAFEQLFHVAARFDAIEGASRGPLDLSGQAGLTAGCSSDRLQDTLGDSGSVIHAVLPHGPGPDLAGEESPGQVWGDRGREYLPPFAEDECGSQGKVGWVVAGDAALGVQLVRGCVTGRMLPMLAGADSRRVYAAVKSKQCNYSLGADPSGGPLSWVAPFSYQALGSGPQQRCSVLWLEQKNEQRFVTSTRVCPWVRPPPPLRHGQGRVVPEGHQGEQKGTRCQASSQGVDQPASRLRHACSFEIRFSKIA